MQCKGGSEKIIVKTKSEGTVLYINTGIYLHFSLLSQFTITGSVTGIVAFRMAIF